MVIGIRIRLWVAASAAIIATTASAVAQQIEHPPELALGRATELSRRHSDVVRGELLAARADSVWLLAEGRVISVRMDEVTGARVVRHDFGAGKVAIWTLIGALATGGGLAIACNQVSDGCGGVFGGVALSWGIVGGLAAISLESSRRVSVDPTEEALRPYARFPQGLPEQMLATEAILTDRQHSPRE